MCFGCVNHTQHRPEKRSIKMELSLRPFSFTSFPNTVRDSKQNVCTYSSLHIKRQEPGRKSSIASPALPETVASIAIAASVVGAAATLLVRRTKEASEATEIPMKICDGCGGSGICPQCKGEGFTLKKLSNQSAERARMTAKNAATRYTAGLPKKWSYCTKCSSSRSCLACGGRGKISY